MQNWLCLQSQGKREFDAEKAIDSCRVDVYAPRFLKLVKEPGRIFERIQPLFPTYLFASPKYYEKLDQIHRLPIRFKTRVIGEIPLQLVEEIHSRETEGLVKMDNQVQPGQPVEVNLGAFCGFHGIFNAKLSDNERCVILLNLMGRQTPITLPISSITPLPVMA